MPKNSSPDFNQLASAFGVDPVDAARHILERERLGKQVPRKLRRAARALVRRHSGSTA